MDRRRPIGRRRSVAHQVAHKARRRVTQAVRGPCPVRRRRTRQLRRAHPMPPAKPGPTQNPAPSSDPRRSRRSLSLHAPCVPSPIDVTSRCQGSGGLNLFVCCSSPLANSAGNDKSTPPFATSIAASNCTGASPSIPTLAITRPRVSVAPIPIAASLSSTLRVLLVLSVVMSFFFSRAACRLGSPCAGYRA